MYSTIQRKIPELEKQNWVNLVEEIQELSEKSKNIIMRNFDDILQNINNETQLILISIMYENLEKSFDLFTDLTQYKEFVKLQCIFESHKDYNFDGTNGTLDKVKYIVKLENENKIIPGESYENLCNSKPHQAFLNGPQLVNVLSKMLSDKVFLELAEKENEIENTDILFRFTLNQYLRYLPIDTESKIDIYFEYKFHDIFNLYARLRTNMDQLGIECGTKRCFSRKYNLSSFLDNPASFADNWSAVKNITELLSSKKKV